MLHFLRRENKIFHISISLMKVKKKRVNLRLQFFLKIKAQN